MSRLASQRMPVFLALLVACGESKRVVDSALASSAGTGGTGVGGAAEYADFGELGTPGCDVPSPDLAPDRFTIGDDGPHAVALSGSKLVLTTPSGLGVMSKDGTDFELIASFRPTCGEGCSGGLDVEALGSSPTRRTCSSRTGTS